MQVIVRAASQEHVVGSFCKYQGAPPRGLAVDSGHELALR